MRGIDLSGLHLRGANFGGSDLRASNLSKSNLKDALFWQARLDGAILAGANFEGADLLEAKLVGAKLANAVFKNTNCFGVDFKGASCFQASFQETVLACSAFAADFREASFVWSDLGGSFQAAGLQGARFVSTSISKTTNFGLANLSGALGLAENDIDGSMVDKFTVAPDDRPESWPDPAGADEWNAAISQLKAQGSRLGAPLGPFSTNNLRTLRHWMTESPTVR